MDSPIEELDENGTLDIDPNWDPKCNEDLDPEPEPDADGDGIPDDEDQCPGEDDTKYEDGSGEADCTESSN